MTFALQTVRQLIDRAQMAHWSLNRTPYPDGAVLLFVNEQQRRLLLSLIAQVEPLIGETQQIAIGTVGGAMVALDDNDVPYYTTTMEDGYLVRLDGTVPYVDTSTPYAFDPFGASGDATPGFPLPDDMLRLIACTVAFSTDQQFDPPHTVEILDQVNATKSGYGHGTGMGLKAFISARRLVPVRQLATDAWADVTSLSLSLVLCPVLETLDDTMTLPDPLVDVLRAQITEFLVNASQDTTENDKRRFTQARLEAEGAAMANGIKILESITTQSVLYLG